MNSAPASPKSLFSGPWIRMANTQLVSLAMIIHKCHDFFELGEMISDEMHTYIARHDQQINLLNDEDLSRISSIVDAAVVLVSCFKHTSPGLVDQVRRFGLDFNLKDSANEDSLITTQVVIRELDHLQSAIREELHRHKFLYIPSPDDTFLRRNKLFGNAVYAAFPSARVEIKEAGTAFAVELYTACVFHLMRVAEHGLRQLARRLHVKLTDKTKFMPLDYADWDKVITGIRNKLSTVRTLPRGPQKQARVEMYSNAADHCEYMKDIWRNTASHTRKSYIKSDALLTMDRVKAFMQFLGESLKAKW